MALFGEETSVLKLVPRLGGETVRQEVTYVIIGAKATLKLLFFINPQGKLSCISKSACRILE